MAGASHIIAFKGSKFFFNLAALLLVATALAKLISATGNARILFVIDPLFGITNRNIMIGAGLCEVAIAVYLIAYKNVLTRSLLLLWLSSNFMFYRIASELLNLKMCPCLGTLAQQFPLTAEQVSNAMTLVVRYMFFGSGAFLMWLMTYHHSPSVDKRPLVQMDETIGNP